MSTSSQFLGAGSSVRLWVSGETVTQWDYRKSPLDGETYQRKTATGGGTTDPADDTTNYAAKSFQRITALTAAPIGPLQIGATPANYFAQGTLKPALAAAATGVRALALSLSGRGNVGFVGLSRAGSGSARLEIFVDGRSVLDVTSTFAANDCAIYFGAAATGLIFGTTNVNLLTVLPDAAGLPFRRTFQVYVTPVTGTFTTADFLAYQMRSES